MSGSTHVDANCIFCKIIKGEIPSKKLAETESSYAFLDIQPLSKGHALIIPKYHAAHLHQLPDASLADLLPLVKRVALATGAAEYNVLQNNGRGAHQMVDHVHFHVIPKPSPEQGLGVGWPAQKIEGAELDRTLEEMKGKM